MNAIMTLFPYKLHGIWVFDDENKNLEREAFVSGMTEIISVLVDKELKTNVDDGFVMHFSAEPFPGHQVHLKRTHSEHGGNWYTWEKENMDGWLCPALFKYYDDAPEDIYVQALLSTGDIKIGEMKPNGITNDLLGEDVDESEPTDAPKGFWALVRRFVSLFIPISI